MKNLISIYIVLLLLSANSILSNAQNKVSKNVIIPEDSIYIEQLDRYRKIRIYLPPEYNNSLKKYPVLYMLDGQNLFDPGTSYAGEWGVDEVLDSLHKTNEIDIIVIGIDNGGMKRMNEYGPWENKKFGKAEAGEFTEFIVNTIKPMIDENYRTHTGRKNTCIAGSSMGGLISHYALFKYPEIFGKAGILSPSYWYSKKVFEFTRSSSINKDQKIYMTIGEKEGSIVIKDLKKMEELLQDKGFEQSNLKVKIVPGKEHNEAFWQSELPEMFIFLFK